MNSAVRGLVWTLHVTLTVRLSSAICRKVIRFSEVRGIDVKMSKVSIALYFLALACLLPLGLKLAIKAGVFVPRLDHSPGPCRVVPGLDCGAEDIAVTKNGLAFISSGFRSETTCKVADIKGRIFLFNFNHPNNNVTALTLISSEINMETFEPHGLGLFEDPDDGGMYLFVVDHSEQNDVVRIFKYDPSSPLSLKHIESIQHPLLQCLNSVAPTGRRTFYSTTYLRLCSVFKHSIPLEFVINIFYGITYVAYYDGAKASVMASGLKFANGIDLSRDGNFVYVISADPYVNVFQRNRATDELTLSKRIPILTNGDNVFVDASGDLYIGATSHMGMTFIADHDGPNAVPTQVVRIHSNASDLGSYKLTEVLHSSGHNFVRFGSTAAHYKRHLLVGSVCHKLGYCFMETTY